MFSVKAFVLAVSSVVLAGSMAQGAAMTGSWSGPSVATPAANFTDNIPVDLPSVGTTDWAWPYKKSSNGTLQTLRQTGGTAIQSIVGASVLSNTYQNTGSNNYAGGKSFFKMNFGPPGSYTGTNPAQPADLQSYGFDPTVADSYNSVVRGGRRPDESGGGTDSTWTAVVALPAGSSKVRMYIGNSGFDNGVTNAGGDNDGYNFSATLAGTTTYSATDWFKETRTQGAVTMTAGEVGYMEITATPDNAGDLLTLSFNNTKALYRRDLFLQGVTVASNAVPEPASLSILAIGLGALLRRRTR